MVRKPLLVLIAGILSLGISKLSFAQSHPGYEYETKGVSEQATSKEAVNVENKICPVSGEKIDEKTKATYEYEGKIYNFCCSSCVEDFKKEPEKYIEKVNEELQAESKQETKEETKEEMKMIEEPASSHSMHGSHHY